MLVKNLPREITWNPWHHGLRYSIKTEYLRGNSYPNNFKLIVCVMDSVTNSISYRRGYGKFIGNFFPIWISWKGQRIQLTQLLEKKD